MISAIAKKALLLVAVIFTVSAASAQTQTQTQTNCMVNGQMVDCTSTSTTTAPPAPIISPQTEQQLNEAAANLGRAIAQRRAEHQQEKNDLTAVVFCRQNPSESWTFPNKAPVPCDTLAKKVVAYCTVNAKTSFCKDVAKLPPQASAPVVAAASQVQLQPQVQPQPEQAPVTTQPLQTSKVSQPQPQTVSATTTTPASEEMSVAEAARRNKAAKEAANAKENPPPQP